MGLDLKTIRQALDKMEDWAHMPTFPTSLKNKKETF